MNHLSAIVLAAGESTRMGHPKALLEWKGQNLLQYQVHSLLEASFDEVVVVLGHQAKMLSLSVPEDPRVRAVISRRHRWGKTQSIKTGLRSIHSNSDGVLIVGVDQPRHIQTLCTLREVFLDRRPTIVVPVFRGTRGHPPVFGSKLFKNLMQISESTQGLRAVVEQYRTEGLQVEVDDPLVNTNLNAPEDYTKARRLADECTCSEVSR